MIITPGENEKEFQVYVTWREDLPQKEIYKMNAKYQEDGSLYYEDCKYVIRTYNEDGTYSDELQYKDGSGLLWYSPTEALLYWTDYTLDPSENVQTFISANYFDVSDIEIADLSDVE